MIETFGPAQTPGKAVQIVSFHLVALLVVGLLASRLSERHQSGKARVIPVIVRPGDYSGTRFKDIQALPRDGKAITLWANRDLAWLDVAKGIRKAVEELAAMS